MPLLTLTMERPVNNRAELQWFTEYHNLTSENVVS